MDEAKNATILLVDDDEMVLRGLRRLLGSLSEVDATNSAADAFVRAQQRQYDLIITDLDMPEHNGLWLLKALSDRVPETRTVLISGRPLEHLELGDDRRYVRHYLEKPFGAQQVAEILDLGPIRADEK